MRRLSFANVFLKLQKFLHFLPSGFWRSLIRASFWGALVAALPYFFVTLPLMLLLLFFNPLNAVAIGLLPLALAWPGALVLLLGILLPSGPWLARMNLATASVFALVGMIGGMVIAFVMFGLFGAGSIDALANAVVGGIGGAVTGALWCRSRQSFAAQPPNGTGGTPRPNPIHDLLH